MSRTTIRTLALALCGLAAAAPATQAAKPVPGGVYIGETADQTNLSFGVTRTGDALYALRAFGVRTDCEDGPGRVEVAVSRVAVRRNGLFRLKAEDEERDTPDFRVSGTFLRGGRVTGRLTYSEGLCDFSMVFTARAQPRGRSKGRVFSLISAPYDGPGALTAPVPDGVPASDSGLAAGGLAALPDGSLVVAAGALRRVGLDGRLSTISGTRGAGASDVDVADDGSILVASAANCVKRVVRGGAVSTAAGQCGRSGISSGDGGPATAAMLEDLGAVSALPGGGLLLVDRYRVRRVSPEGTISTVAGTGELDQSGDGGPAIAAELSPTDVEALADGSFLVADSFNSRVRKVDASGVITTVAGKGVFFLDREGVSGSGFAGDGGPATDAQLSAPSDVVAIPGGGFLIADAGTGRVRRVSRAGRITTIAGGGDLSFGGSPLSSDLSGPRGLGFSMALVPGGVAVSSISGVRQIVTGATPRLLGGFVLQTDGAGLAPATDPRGVAGLAADDRLAPRSRFRSRRRGRPRLRVALNRPATVTIEVRKRKRVVRRIRRRLRAGTTYPRLRRLPKGRYGLVLTARSGRRVARSRSVLEVR